MQNNQNNRKVKANRNAEYLARLDRAIEQLASGKGQQHDLLEDDEGKTAGACKGHYEE